MILDGSCSFGEDGWDHMQHMGSMLFDAWDMGNDTQIGTNSSAEFEDCVMSEWIRTLCSEQWGDGLEKYTREVARHVNGGAKCPPPWFGARVQLTELFS